MATILEALKGVNAYPVPFRTLVETAEGHGLVLTDEATATILRGKAFRLSTADIYLWLSLAPDISQGGQSYSFSDEQRKQFRNQANSIYAKFGTENTYPTPTYGYKGSSL